MSLDWFPDDANTILGHVILFIFEDQLNNLKTKKREILGVLVKTRSKTNKKRIVLFRIIIERGTVVCLIRIWKSWSTLFWLPSSRSSASSSININYFWRNQTWFLINNHKHLLKHIKISVIHRTGYSKIR